MAEYPSLKNALETTRVNTIVQSETDTKDITVE